MVDLAQEYRERHVRRGLMPPHEDGPPSMLIGVPPDENSHVYRTFYSNFGACLDLTWLREEKFRYVVASPCCGAVLEGVEDVTLGFDEHGYGTVTANECLFCTRRYDGSELVEQFATLEEAEAEVRSLLVQFAPAMDPIQITLLIQDYFHAIREALDHPSDESYVVALAS